jgi:hypothetical protein
MVPQRDNLMETPPSNPMFEKIQQFGPKKE